MLCFKITQNKIQSIHISLDEIKDKIDNFYKRDFYFFDNKMNFDISSLTIKKNCIICKFDNIKSIIFLDEGYIIYNLLNHNNIKIFFENKYPFHINLLEYLLSLVTESFDKEFNNIFNKFLEFDSKLEVNDNFLKLQTKLLNLAYRVKELQKVTEDLIKNKKDIDNLTFEIFNSDELEQMIENYNLKIDDIYNYISKLLNEMDNIQKIENIQLAKDRNKYALINLYISFISLSFSFGSFIGGMFGMNLRNNMENNKYSFVIVIIFTLIIMITIIGLQFCFLYKR